MEVIKSCENCRHGRQVGYDEYDREGWLCTNPESDHAWQAAVQDGYCDEYRPEKLCGTCRYCELELDGGGYSGQYVCRNEANMDEDGCMPVDPDYDEACDEWELGEEG